MSKKSSIVVQHAGMGYRKGSRQTGILSGVDLSFYAGDLVGIVGLNGVGKSTLLRSIAGLLPLLEGKILIEGKNLYDYPIAELAKKMAIVLTEKIGGFNLTLTDVVAAGQIPYTNSFHHLTPAHLKIVQGAIERCGIVPYQNKPVNELSDGVFQKTMIAKALAQQTPILLLDEPSAFLDYASKHALYILLRDLCLEEQKCVLVSSHELEMLLKYCSKLLVISEQGMELITCEEAKNNKAFLQLTGGFL